MTTPTTSQTLSPVRASEFELGDVVKIKRSDKTKSPYSTIRGVNDERKSLDIEPFDAPGNGNRAARRARYASERKAKK